VFDFFSGKWADTPKPLSPRLKDVVQKVYPGQTASLRAVRFQPLLYNGDASAVNQGLVRVN
jgi:hypothetical protein